MEHRIVNGLHIVEANGRIEVYTKKEYRDLEIQSSRCKRAKKINIKISEEAKFFIMVVVITALFWTLIIWGLNTSTPYNPV
jgi:hypothetical protein